MPDTPSVSPDISLRVLTVNTHKGFTFFNRKFILHELRDAVRDVAADVVFLQEVQGNHAARAMRHATWPDAPHHEFLADSIWPEFAYGRNAVYPGGHHGNAVLSKFPIERFQNRDVSISGPERRGLLHCVLRVPGVPSDVHVVCVHLGLKESHRQKQLALLCDLVNHEAAADEPVIVAGDFNDWQRRAGRMLSERAGLREVFMQAHGRTARSFPARLPLLQLDRIYVRHSSGHEPVMLPRRPWSHLSDHAPLAADIKLAGAVRSAGSPADRSVPAETLP